MHILFLTDNYPPEVNAPASRTHEHCREWVKRGHDVTVITCHPNFPHGKIYKGYKNRVWHSEVVDGIRVVRVWTYITSNEGFFKRTIDYLSYMFAAIFAAVFIRRVDLVVGTSPQFFTVCAAYIVAFLKRVPWVFELRDIWPESIRVVGAMKDSWVLDALQRLEMFLYRKADGIVTVTHSFKKELMKRGVDGEKINVVTNGVDLSRFSAVDKDVNILNRHELANKFVVGYIGTHGMAHELDTVLDTARLISEVDELSSIVFIFVGGGADKKRLVERQRQEKIDNVVFVDSVAKDEIVSYWSCLDCCVVHLKASILFETVIPSKIFEAMAMGVPILHGVLGESAKIVTDEEVGVTFKPEDPEDLAEKIVSLVADPSTRNTLSINGAQAGKKYDRSRLAVDMCCVLEGLHDNSI